MLKKNSAMQSAVNTSLDLRVSQEKGLAQNKLSSMFGTGERQGVLAPPETEWYHGRLDRYTSEERLWAAGKLGSYLGMCSYFKSKIFN